MSCESSEAGHDLMAPGNQIGHDMCCVPRNYLLYFTLHTLVELFLPSAQISSDGYP